MIKDAAGEVVFDSRLFLGADVSHHFAQYMALINGLDYAQQLGLRRISAYGHQAFMYWEVVSCLSDHLNVSTIRCPSKTFEDIVFSRASIYGYALIKVSRMSSPHC
jgi:hypothetical protein